MLLKLNDRPFGKVDGRWIAETLDIRLLEQRRLVFRKKGWLASEFSLRDAETNSLLGHARPAGIFTTTWDLALSIGTVRLVRKGWFALGFEVKENNDVWAQVDRAGRCSRGWYVEGADDLSDTDLLLIGLVFHVVQRRRAQHQSAASHGS
jgi:hypothetical protein